MNRAALLPLFALACGAPFTAADPLPAQIDPNRIAPEAGAAPEDAPPEASAPEASDDDDAPAPDAAREAAAPDACASPDAYACGVTLLTIETPAFVCLLSAANGPTERATPPACACEYTCACLLASGAFCAAAQCSEGSGFPIIRGCT